MHETDNAQPKILTYGHDAVLLKTRALLLEEAGYVVTALTSREAFETTIQSHHSYDLLVFCHSVPEEEQYAIAKTIAGSNNTKVYQLDCAVDPSVFLETVSDLLRRLGN